MAKLPFLALVLVLALPSAWADDVQIQEPAKPKLYYILVEPAYVHNSYGSTIQAPVNSIESDPFSSTVSVAFGLDFGFYFVPGGEGSLGYGFSSSAIADVIATSGASLGLTQGLIGGSVMKFLGDEFGTGLYGRADLGLAYLLVQTSTGAKSSFDGGIGVGGKAEIGYTFRVSQNARLGLSASGTYRVYSTWGGASALEGGLAMMF